MKWSKLCPVMMISVFLALLMASCSPPASSPTSAPLSGQVVDMYTGQPVSGASIVCASFSGTSASNGSFSIDLGAGATAYSGGYSVSAPTYAFTYINPVTLYTGHLPGYPSLLLSLLPINSSGYTTHTIAGKIYNSTSTEIANGSSVNFYVLNANGGFTTKSLVYSGGYSLQTMTFGSSCLVVAAASGVMVVLNNVDLSALSTTLDLHATTQMNVSVTGDQVNNSGTLVYTLYQPNGLVNAGSVNLSTNPANLAIVNPNNYLGYWVQQQIIANTPSAGNEELLLSGTPRGTVDGSAVVLQPIAQSFCPSAVPNASLLTYSSGSGVLSVSSVMGANLYMFTLLNGSSQQIGLIYSGSPSVTLPASIKAMLAGQNVNVQIVPMTTDLNFDVSVVGAQLAGVPFFPMGAHFGEIVSMGAPYQKTLSF